MTHLIIGSAGQIGKHLIEYFKNKGEDVIEFDIENNISEDLRIPNNPILEAKIKECDMVYFLAYDVGGAKYLEQNQDKYEFLSNNMKIMTNTFDIISRYNKPFMFASSQMSELAYSNYGLLKNIGEKITKSLNGLVVRFWNVYGYEKDESKSHVITDFIKMAKYNGVIKMRTDGQESRQLLYADDCAECLLTLSKNYNDLDKDKNYHITNFEWVKVLEVAKIIQKLSGCKIVVDTKKDATQKNAMNNADSYILKFWKPTISLEQGIEKLYNQY